MLKPFEWNPGIGVDPAALARLRGHFKRPNEPMGEAWFMGEERRIFAELGKDLSILSARQLQKPLEEIASGTSSFGPRDEWNQWYHYLLPQLVPRSHENFVRSLLESLLTAFFALHPNGIGNAACRSFQDDVLQTLGRCLMEPQCWNGADIRVGSFLHRPNDNPGRVWCWRDASGDFSASMFFCLKYLPMQSISCWLASALAIESPHWRAQMLVWLVGAHDMLHGQLLWPSELQVDACPSISWEGSHCLRPELAQEDESGLSPVQSLVPEPSRLKALEVVRAYFTEDVFLVWLESIGHIPCLESALAELPASFEHLYVRRR